MKIEAKKRGISGNDLVVLAVEKELKRSKKTPAAALKDLEIDFEGLWDSYRSFLPKGKTSAKTESARRLLAFVKRHKASHDELCDAFLLYLEGTERKYRREFQYFVTQNLQDALEQVRNPPPPPEPEPDVETVEEEIRRLKQWIEQASDSDDDVDLAVGIRRRIKELELTDSG